MTARRTEIAEAVDFETRRLPDRTSHRVRTDGRNGVIVVVRVPTVLRRVPFREHTTTCQRYPRVRQCPNLADRANGPVEYYKEIDRNS